MKTRIENILASIRKVLVASWCRRFVAVSIYIILPIVLLLMLRIAGEHRAWVVTAGKIAQVFLLIILFMKPLGVITRNEILSSALMYRQAMGVAMLYVALFHAYNLFDFSRIFDLSYYTYTQNILYGALALIVTLVLGVTSNRFAMRHLRRGWKRLHRLAYPLLFLVFVHVSIATGEKKMIVLAVAFITLKVMEKKKIHITIPIISRTDASMPHKKKMSH